jgi:hypothetical protein
MPDGRRTIKTLSIRMNSPQWADFHGSDDDGRDFTSESANSAVAIILLIPFTCA